ncbi:MAG: hypothetical protein ACK5KM_05955 [Hyphomicrobiaceae bacterium]
MSHQAAQVLHQIDHTLSSWAQRNLEETMRYMARDVVYTVNVNSDIAPFAASTNGIEELRQRLRLMLDTFHFDAFVFDAIRPPEKEGAAARVGITYFYREKTTNQPLDGRCRVNFYFRDGYISRVEELYDSRYVEAFARLVAALNATMEHAQ